MFYLEDIHLASTTWGFHARQERFGKKKDFPLPTVSLVGEADEKTCNYSKVRLFGGRLLGLEDCEAEY